MMYITGGPMCAHPRAGQAYRLVRQVGRGRGKPNYLDARRQGAL